jgi:hypothetical protein
MDGDGRPLVTKAPGFSASKVAIMGATPTDTSRPLSSVMALRNCLCVGEGGWV